MFKTKKILAIIAIFAILFSNCFTLLSSVVYATNIYTIQFDGANLGSGEEGNFDTNIINYIFKGTYWDDTENQEKEYDEILRVRIYDLEEYVKNGNLQPLEVFSSYQGGQMATLTEEQDENVDEKYVIAFEGDITQRYCIKLGERKLSIDEYEVVEPVEGDNRQETIITKNIADLDGKTISLEKRIIKAIDFGEATLIKDGNDEDTLISYQINDGEDQIQSQLQLVKKIEDAEAELGYRFEPSIINNVSNDPKRIEILMEDDSYDNWFIRTFNFNKDKMELFVCGENVNEEMDGDDLYDLSKYDIPDEGGNYYTGLSVQIFARHNYSNPVPPAPVSGFNYQVSNAKIIYKFGDNNEVVDDTFNPEFAFREGNEITITDNTLNIKLIPEHFDDILRSLEFYEYDDNQSQGHIINGFDYDEIRDGILSQDGYNFSLEQNKIYLLRADFGVDEGPQLPRTHATVKISGGEGGYYETRYNEDTKEDEEVLIPYAESYINSRISINGEYINTEIHENEVPEFLEREIDYPCNEEDETVRINFGSLFIHKYTGIIKVNGNEYNVSDYIDYSNRTDWLKAYGYQETSFEIEVPKAENYDIVINVEPLEGHYQYIGNFLWTSNPNEQYRRDPEGNIQYDQDGKPEINDNYIGNSRIELVKVVYEVDENKDGEIDDNEVITVTENFDEDQYIEYYPDGDFGSLVVPEGSEVTMKITPEYGYQVTSFGINGGEIATGDVSEFTFPIHKGNFHLGAQVTKVDDIVDSQTDLVTDGTIKIDNKEIDSGTVVLTVEDAELSEEQISTFENKAKGYEISSYLNFELNQVFYKGNVDENGETKTDEDDIWSNSLGKEEELKRPATITLQLAEGIDGDKIVIVHKKHDGTYEIIPTIYNPEEGTITFKTLSFSNYAIASHAHTPVTQKITKVKRKATLSKDGEIIIDNTVKCSECGEQIGGAGKIEAIYYPKTISLAKTSYTYNGKVQKPTVTVKDKKGKTIDSSNYTLTYSDKNSKTIGEYKVTITFKGDKYEGTKILKYKIVPKGSSLSKLTAAKKSYKVTWKAQKTETTGYEIQYSTDKNFKKENKTVNIGKNKTTSATVKKLAAKKKYYVRIRTYKKVGKTTYYSDWSGSKNVITK